MKSSLKEDLFSEHIGSDEHQDIFFIALIKISVNLSSSAMRERPPKVPSLSDEEV